MKTLVTSDPVFEWMTGVTKKAGKQYSITVVWLLKPLEILDQSPQNAGKKIA